MPARRTRYAWPQLAALWLGVAFTVEGLAGFLMTGVHDFFGTARASLLGFTVNPFHDVVHLFLGVSGIVLAHRLATARTYGWILATLYGAGFVYGLFAAGQQWDLLALNWPDNVVHLLLAIAGGALAAGPVAAGLDDHPARP
jgi:uncharacterized membrane protein YjdF